MSGSQQAQDGGVAASPFELGQGAAEVDEAVHRAASGLHALVPPWWQGPSALGLERWQWLAIPIVALTVGALTWVLVRLTRLMARRIAAGSGTRAVLEHLSGPLTLGWASVLARLALPLLGFETGTEGWWDRALRLGLGLGFFWGALRGVRAWADHFSRSDFAHSRPGSRALVNLATRVTRFALVGMAVLTVLSALGYSVTSVLAGLGIGGIALALGAQKTLENVFGAFALAVDQPIREGDFVRVEDVQGSVESIGLRSTRIRTLDRTVVTIPNGKLADLRLETFAARDRIRLFFKPRLTHDTSAASLQAVIEAVKTLLKAEPLLWPGEHVVGLLAIEESGLELEVIAWFSTTDYEVFRGIRERVLLGFLKALDTHGARLAYPMRSVQVSGPISVRQPAP